MERGAQTMSGLTDQQAFSEIPFDQRQPVQNFFRHYPADKILALCPVKSTATKAPPPASVKYFGWAAGIAHRVGFITSCSLGLVPFTGTGDKSKWKYCPPYRS